MRKPKDVNVRAFTQNCGSIQNVLISNCKIGKAWTDLSDPSRQVQQPNREYAALWDTGATNSGITRKVVQECQLVPIGRARAEGAHGSKEVDTFLVNLSLPNGVTANGIRVAEIDDIKEADVLIGMDIINFGDFAVSNRGTETVFTFRMPSMERFDFVRELKKRRR